MLHEVLIISFYSPVFLESLIKDPEPDIMMVTTHTQEVSALTQEVSIMKRSLHLSGKDGKTLKICTS